MPSPNDLRNFRMLTVRSDCRNHHHRKSVQRAAIPTPLEESSSDHKSIDIGEPCNTSSIREIGKLNPERLNGGLKDRAQYRKLASANMSQRELS